MPIPGTSCLLALALLLSGCDPDPRKPDDTGPPDGSVDNDLDGFFDHEDCDDNDKDINPNAAEVCNGVDDDCDGQTDEEVTTTYYLDADVDGFGSDILTTDACDRPAGYLPTGGDCDDSHDTVHPGAAETCDGLDNNCDGSVDEGVMTTFHADFDNDTYGDPGATLEACSAPVGYVLDATDCDDARATIWPGAAELCDERDNDCDADVDEGVMTTFYLDDDEDTYGDPAQTTEACACPSGYVENDLDCDDADVFTHPEADEACNELDDDCDGDVDEGAASPPLWHLDADRDGYGDPTVTAAACDAPSGYLSDASDCDDTNPSINPSKKEVCDGRDNDCDGDVDEVSAADVTTWYLDYDGDGFGEASISTLACDAPDGYCALSGDCDDRNRNAYPGAEETCNYEDDDCDGDTDEADATDAATWHPDTDRDGYGAAATSTVACFAPTGWLSDGLDCDDSKAAINPAATERCDGVDNDCDGTTDVAAVDAATWYADADADTWGDPTITTSACTVPGGHVAVAGDCDDTTAAAHPGADEVCDDLDNDCDGSVDEASASDAGTWYRDADGDGWGGASASAEACDPPAGYVAATGDCNDANPVVYPGAVEVCDSLDDDCDGTVDEAAVDAPTWYADADRDAWGEPATSTVACTAPSGYTADGTDCDDTAAAVNPAATEVCDAVDNDCDGLTDDASAADARTWYADGDTDGYGDPAESQRACSPPTGWVLDATDCNDTTSAASPVAEERCDGIDNDCDATIDEASAVDAGTWYTDADGDGWGATGFVKACTAPAGTTANPGDCDDTRAILNPGADELCNGTDDNCDGLVDDASSVDAPTWYTDADGDGYGTSSSPLVSCTGGSGLSSLGTDCDDTDDTRYPGRLDICSDGIDNDCVDGDRSCRIASTENTSAADGMLVGENAGDYSGYAIANAGDVDADGLADILVGAPYADAGLSNAGRVYLVHGPVTYIMNLAGADATFSGEDSNDYAGQAVASAGDLNADGFDDIIIGAHRDDTTTTDAGCAYLQLGPLSGSSSLSLFDAKLTGTTASDYAGYAVASAGDVSDDGKDDVIVGAYLNDSGGSSAGMAYLVSGNTRSTSPLSSALARFMGEDASDYAGFAVSGAGDIDGDGVDDLLIGAYGDDQGGSASGAVYVIDGPATGSRDLAAADAKIYGESSNDYLGYALTSLGDVDGDGYGEILLGAYGDASGGAGAGATYVLSGPIVGIVEVTDTRFELARFIGETAGDNSGRSLASAGDVNGDGFTDLLIGAYLSSRGAPAAGATYLVMYPYAGTMDLSTADAAILGEVAYDYSGMDVDAGDTDGDGFSDVLIGGYGHTFSGADDGATFVFFGG